MKIVWLPEARDDIQHLYDFLVDKDPHAAERAIRAIELGARRLNELARIGRRMDDDTGRRELYIPFGAGAYVLRYRIHSDTVAVIRVCTTASSGRDFGFTKRD